MFEHFPVPTVWAGVSLLFGSMATLFVVIMVNRRFGPLQKQALTGLVEAQKAQVDLTRDSLVMQKEHYESELTEMKKERDTYRNALHDEKEAHQAALLTVADLQARPNVDRVYESQQTFFSQMITNLAELAVTMKAIQFSIHEHDAGIEARTVKLIGPVQDMCAEVVRALNGHKLKKVPLSHTKT